MAQHPLSPAARIRRHVGADIPGGGQAQGRGHPKATERAAKRRSAPTVRGRTTPGSRRRRSRPPQPRGSMPLGGRAQPKDQPDQLIRGGTSQTVKVLGARAADVARSLEEIMGQIEPLNARTAEGPSTEGEAQPSRTDASQDYPAADPGTSSPPMDLTPEEIEALRAQGLLP